MKLHHDSFNTNKGTQSTIPMQFKLPPEREKYHEWKQLYKENSQQQSDQPIVRPQIKPQFLQPPKEVSGHDQIKKFLKKADEINEYNYKKLQQQRPSFPNNGNSAGNLYKSSKNILQELNRERDQQIKQTYLGHRNKRQEHYHPKIYKKSDSIYMKKKIMASIEVQTEKQVEELPKKNKRYEHAVSNKGISMNSIKEDGDEEMALEKKKRRGISTHNGYDRNKIFNTVSITAQLPKKWQNNREYIEKKYLIRKQNNQRTIFHEKEKKNENGVTQIANKTYLNFWSNEINDQNDEKNNEVQQNQKQKIPPIKKVQQKSNKPKSMKKDVSTLVSIHRQTEVQNKPSERSLIVEENNSQKYTQPTDLVIKESHIYSSKMASGIHSKQKEQIKEICIQFPEVSELVIGNVNNTNSSNMKKSIHPINIDFDDNDALWITQTYKPKSQFLRKINHKNFQIKKYKNGVYFGEISEEGLKHGKGVVFYFNGRSYEGNFNQDLKEGKGYEYFPDGSHYSGDFNEGYKEGRGVFEWPNGQIYDGQWQGGKKNGSGMWKSPDGDSYIGEWKKGKVEGFGVFVSKNGDRYEGQFKKSMKHGLGTERYSNGDTYVGLFSKNRPNGQGQLYYKNGDYYKGQFTNGLKHGKGILKEDNGDLYKGQYRNDKKCGFGEITTQDGDNYVGNFENDLKHGYGESYQNNISVFKGYWMNNDIVNNSMTPMRLNEKGNYLLKQKSKSKSKSKSRKKKIGKSIEKERIKNNNSNRNRNKNKEKSPKNERKKSIQKSLSPGSIERACGCKRKH